MNLKYVYEKYLKIFFIFLIICFLIFLHFMVLKPFKSLEKDYWTVIIDSNSIPFNFSVNDKNKYGERSDKGIWVSGAEIMLIKKIANKASKDLKIKIKEFGGLEEAIIQGDADFALSAKSVTAPRLQNPKLIFSKPYHFPSVGLLVRKDNKNFFDIPKENGYKLKFDEFIEEKKNIGVEKNQKKLKIIALNGHFHDDNIKRIMNELKTPESLNQVERVEAVSEMAAAVKQVREGVVDAFMIDYDCAKEAADSISDELIAFSWISYRPQYLSYPYAIIFENSLKGSFLKKEIDRYLEEILFDDIQDIPKREKFKKEFIKIKTKDYETKDTINNFDFNQTSVELKEFIENKMQKWIKESLSDLQKARKISQVKGYNFYEKTKIILGQYLPGYWTSLFLAVDGLIIGFILSLLLVKIKISDNKNFNQNKYFFCFKQILSYLIDFFIFIFKSIPIGALAIFVYYGLLRSLKKYQLLYIWHIEPLHAGLIVIVLNSTVNIASIISTHIKFINQGEIESAYALGMTKKQVFRYIIFQQALKRSYSSILNQLIINIKDSGFLHLIGVAEVMFIAQRNMTLNVDLVTPFLIVSGFYLVTIGIINFFNYYLKKKVYRI